MFMPLQRDEKHIETNGVLHITSRCRGRTAFEMRTGENPCLGLSFVITHLVISE